MLKGALVLAFAVAAWTAVIRSDEVRVISAVGMRQVMLDLAPKFEAVSGRTLSMTFESSGIIVKRLAAGEPFDVILINQAGIDRLMRERLIASFLNLATAQVGVAVRAGTVKPDIATVDAFKRLMIRSRMIAYPDPALDGSSGVHIADVFARLGIANAMKAKTIYADPPGPAAETPGSLVAKGKADVALHQLQELSAVPGIDVVGPIPDAIQQTFLFSIAVSAQARDGVAATALVNFLQTKQSRAVMTAKGMGVPPPRF